MPWLRRTPCVVARPIGGGHVLGGRLSSLSGTRGRRSVRYTDSTWGKEEERGERNTLEDSISDKHSHNIAYPEGRYTHLYRSRIKYILDRVTHKHILRQYALLQSINIYLSTTRFALYVPHGTAYPLHCNMARAPGAATPLQPHPHLIARPHTNLGPSLQHKRHV